MNEIIQAIIDANKEIFYYINNSLKSDDFGYSGIIGAGGDNSSVIDLKAEAIFVKHLLPFGDILSEESGLIKSHYQLSTTNYPLFVIDPLDGSDNFMARLPYFGSSVSYEINGEVTLAAIANFCNGECIVYDGKDKTLYDLATSKQILLLESENPKIGVFERAYKFPKMCEILTNLNIKYRSPGAVALTLANAHNYQFVLFGGKMREYDLKAGLFMTKDLYRFENDKFLLISKNFEIFTKLKEFITEV